MKQYINYFIYLIKHKLFVLKACKITKCPLWLGIIHDWSKFIPSEFFPYANRFYYPNGLQRKNSQSLSEKQILLFDKAWWHHQKNNKHHWNYWVIVKDSGGLNSIPIPKLYIKEMIADWIGAGLSINGKLDIKPWYYQNRKNMIIEKNTLYKIEEIIRNIN
jgi:hypothetical protein